MPKVIQTIKSSKINLILSSYIKFYRNLRIIGISASAILTVIMTLTVFPLQTNTHIAEAAPGTATAATTVLQMTSSFENARLNLVVKSSDGTFAASSENELAKFGITTNNFTGYTLTISGPENTDLTNSDTNKVFTSVQIATDAYTFENGSGNMYNGKYGYKPNQTYDATNKVAVPNTDYLPAPTEAASTLDVTTEANNESNNYTIGLGARADYDTPNGTYSNTFTLNLVGNPVSYAITYADNSGDSEVSNLPEATTGKTTDLSIPITEDAPTRPGYALSKWCLGEVADEGMTCNGTEYAPGADFEIDQTTQNITTLYAVWVESYEGYLQDFTAAQCAEMSVGDNKILRDTRDDQDYIIGKLADNNCWFLDNLRLGAADLKEQFTTFNTNMSGSISFTLLNSDSINSYSAAQINTNFTNTIDSDSSKNYGEGSHKYGVFYNYCAASAGTYCMAGGSGSGDASYDICPSGWRMPTGGGSGEYQSLYVAYSSDRTDLLNALSIPLSGWFNETAANQGAAGFFWTSTFSGSYSMYRFSIAPRDMDVTNSNLRGNGLTVRCIKKDPLEEANLGTMQEIGSLSASAKSDLLESLPEGVSYKVDDSRDSQTYTVAKINGNLWMTRNLAIGCNGSGATYGSSVSSKSLTSSNSNVSSTWSTPTALLTNADYSSATSGYTTAAMMCDSAYGAWYNYAAATAGTIASSSNSNDATYDICPKGWRLSSQSEFTGITSHKDAFKPVFGGNYQGGNIVQTEYGRWWSSTAYYGDRRYLLTNTWSSLTTTTFANRYLGYYVRCTMDNTMADAGVETLQDLGNLSVADKTALLDKMPTGTSYTLTDSRDGQEYAVAKLADGNIWLLDNLRLGAVDLKEQLSTANTNMDENTPFTLPTSISSGFSSYTEVQINTDYANTTTTSYGVGSGKIGTYYNYCAASAGTHCMPTGNDPSISSYDICPSGWRMPTSSSSGEYKALYTAYNNNVDDFRAALSTPLSGRLYGAYFEYQGSGGFFWGSAYQGGGNMLFLYVYSSGVNPSNYNSRGYGLSIRCIMKPMTISGRMQDAAPANGYIDGATGSLTDYRDNQTYTVAKINGQLWMTRNLAIGCSGTGTTYTATRKDASLTSSNSNVSSSYTISTSTTPDLSAASSKTETADYSNPRMQCNATYGAWYNYAAASAKSITDTSNATEASYSICPSGWRLPSQTEFAGIASYKDAFSPVTGGVYYDGSLNRTSVGRWWSSTARNDSLRYHLLYNGSTLDATNSNDRIYGVYVRCIRSA